MLLQKEEAVNQYGRQAGELAFTAWRYSKYYSRGSNKIIHSKEQGYLGQGGNFEGFLGDKLELIWEDK